MPGMRRRDVVALLGGAAAAWPLAARGQQSNRMARVGVLIAVADDAEGQARLGAFKNGMRDLGWTDGGNVRIDYRWAAGDRFQRYAEELLALAPDVVLASATQSVQALQQATRAVPIVFANVGDPVASGIALANGVAYFTTIVSNRLVALDTESGAVLKEVVIGPVWCGPSVSRGRVYVGSGNILFSPQDPREGYFPKGLTGTLYSFGLPGVDEVSKLGQGNE